jgi:hypothetical protein
MTEAHLGEQTFVKWDGQAITLRKDSGFEGCDPEITLTPAILNELVLFIEDTFSLRITVGSKSGGDFSAFIEDEKEREKKANV